KSEEYFQFKDVLYQVTEYLAKEIARDGEGATKLIEVEVKNALTDIDAGKIAKAVAGSLLVKAAIYGHDPNWGRIFAAAGYSGAQIDVNKIDLFVKEKIVSDGQPLPFSKDTVRKYLEESTEIKIIIDLKIGNGKATAWGCDLTHEYVNINTKYN
ncbi:MAG TPA: bifunctional ornithine acetyltransferase/N-acetylglutamate synthase, partial [Atribacterota bacterium]|nr:bifunctional ornithine acetyltransferase/N-acetylglutamate synthase [Atribacterota bacterium]